VSGARFLETLYRRSLVLYPSSFRERFEDEMVEFFRDRLREAGRSGGDLSRVVVALRGFFDLVVGSTAERFESRRARRRKRSKERSSIMLEAISSCLGQAMRTLAHRPGLSAAVVSTLALGVGANTVVFSVVDAVLLRSLPYPEPDRIVTLWNRYGVASTPSSPPDYMDRREESHRLDAIAAVASRPMNLTGSFEARRVEASRVTSDFFRVMGVTPETGPVVFPVETSGEATGIAVLSFALWQSLYGGAPDVLGRSMRLDGESYLVAGVLPERFDFPPRTEVFLPLVFTPEELSDDFRGNEYLLVVGRMKEDVELEAVREEMSAIAAGVGEKVPTRRDFLERNGWGATVVPLREHLLAGSETALGMLSVAVLIVLLGTGANVAHLLLSSGSARGNELSVRSSLGATRGRLFTELVSESMILSLGGALVGVVLAHFLLQALARLLPASLSSFDEASLDGRALGFTLATAVVMGILCGSIPAWQGARFALAGSRRQSSTRAARRLRSVFVTTEVALALVLMVAGALLVQSFRTLATRDPGFDPRGRLSFTLDFPRSLYPEVEERRNVARLLLERLRDLPGAPSASASDRIPLDGQTWTGTFYAEGQTLGPGEPVPGADFNSVSPGYLRTLGVPLQSGRDFASTDRTESPGVVLVDESLEGRFFPSGALGRYVNLNGPSRPPNLLEIVGVVGHVAYESLDEPGRFQIYFPVEQARWRRLSFTLDADGDPARLTADLRREVSALAPDLAVQSVRGLDSVVLDSLAFRELQASAIAAFGFLALALAVVGIYGVLSYSVTQRTMEVGVRMAFGASRLRVVALVLREGLVLAVVGVGLGGIVSLAFSRPLESLLFGIRPLDVPTYLTVTTALTLVGLAAALVPALRAAGLDPISALRRE
jgi:putative ABC transport system permease protein